MKPIFRCEDSFFILRSAFGILYIGKFIAIVIEAGFKNKQENTDVDFVVKPHFIRGHNSSFTGLLVLIHEKRVIPVRYGSMAVYCRRWEQNERCSQQGVDRPPIFRTEIFFLP